METIGQKLDKVILRAALDKERKLDDELERQQEAAEAVVNMCEDDIEEIRRKRLEQMKDEHAQKQNKQRTGHGTYEDLTDEKEFFTVTKDSDRMLVHFYRPATWRCEIVDKHFREFCRKHWRVRFCRINAEKVPFLCERLNIWCLPSVVCIKKGHTEHTIVGFSELSGDEHTTEEYERLLAKWEMVDLEY
eukprot:GEMP01025337.1.p1 GENE.GEMP01025337.1~~GEMP01025337.1.p1  ORF type:complete len:190 (+),score=49.27 GEMP01025337.1:92-661(+)